MTTPLTIYRFGLCGNSANESIGKHRFRTKKHQKANKSSQKTAQNRFGYWRPGVRISTLRPKRKESPCGSLFFFDQVRNESSIRAIARRSSHIARRGVELARKPQVQISCRKAIPPHFDQKEKRVLAALFSFCPVLFASTPFVPCGIV